MMSLAEGMAVSILGGLAVGFIVWVVLRATLERLPGEVPADAGTRAMEKYMEHAKQGMK